jgi:transcriptional regulator with XRE-family HTH domain
MVELRNNSKMTQEEAAKESGINRSRLARLETNPKENPCLTTLTKIANVFDLTVAELLSYKDEA